MQDFFKSALIYPQTLGLPHGRRDGHGVPGSAVGIIDNHDALVHPHGLGRDTISEEHCICAPEQAIGHEGGGYIIEVWL